MQMNVDQLRGDDLLADHELLRSNFVRRFVQHYKTPTQTRPAYIKATPKRIVQFWDNLDVIVY